MSPKPRRGKRGGVKRLPLVSSDNAIAALSRLDFVLMPGSGGSHRRMYRENPDGTKDVTVIVLGFKELPKGTLQGILRLAKVSKRQFRDAL